MPILISWPFQATNKVRNTKEQTPWTAVHTSANLLAGNQNKRQFSQTARLALHTSDHDLLGNMILLMVMMMTFVNKTPALNKQASRCCHLSATANTYLLLVVGAMLRCGLAALAVGLCKEYTYAVEYLEARHTCVEVVSGYARARKMHAAPAQPSAAQPFQGAHFKSLKQSTYTT